MTDTQFLPDTPDDLHRFARVVYARRAGVALADLDAHLAADPTAQADLDAVTRDLYRPSQPEAYLIIEVEACDPADADLSYHSGDRAGQSFREVRRYALQPIVRPSHSHSVVPWALRYGGRS